MEISSISPSFIIWIGVIACLIAWPWKVLNWVWLKPKRLEMCLRQQGLHGNSYKLFFGDLRQNFEMLRQASSKPINFSDDIFPRVSPFLHNSINNHGKTSFMWYGPTPRVNITDPDLIKEIFLNYNDFQKPRKNKIIKLIATGLSSYEGDQWVKHRRIINPAFHAEKLKHMLPAFYTSCSLLLEEWDKLITPGESCEVDVWPFLQTMTRDVISRTAFGSSYEEGKKIFEHLEEIIILAIQAAQSSFIPGWRFLPTKTNRTMKNIDKNIQLLLEGIIKKREKAMQRGEAPTDDLLGMLMESNLKEIKEHGNSNKNIGMSIGDVIEECKQFYLAGQETTSGVLTWAMILLSKHPEWQKYARDEVSRVFGNDKQPNIDGLNHLNIMTMIINEVLRLYPPLAVLSRAVYKDTKLGNFYLPAGVEVSIPTILIHLDQEIWGPDALEFNPGRFSEGVSMATKSRLTYFPFGWGPRICIAQNFAMLETKIALAMILQRFSFEISPSYAHAPISVTTTRPQFGAQLILHKL